MTGLLLRAAGLTAIYLLVLTSVHPGDVAVGAVLGLGVAVGLRSRHGGVPAPSLSWLGLARVLGQTAVEMVLGSWRTVRFCLGSPGAPGLVEIPREDRTAVEVGLWGVLTGEAPDELPIDVDTERGVLVVHLVDARDPDAVRARHRRAHRCLRDGKAS